MLNITFLNVILSVIVRSVVAPDNELRRGLGDCHINKMIGHQGPALAGVDSL